MVRLEKPFSVRWGTLRWRNSLRNMRRAFTLSFITRDACMRENVLRAHTRTRARETVDILINARPCVEAVDMRSENLLTVTLLVSSLNPNYPRRIAARFAKSYRFSALAQSRAATRVVEIVIFALLKNLLRDFDNPHDAMISFRNFCACEKALGFTI